MLKINLHFHSAEDPRHRIPYTIYEGIDYARAKGFDALALTPHRAFASTPEHAAYAAQRRVTLIPGIEADLYDERGRRSHVVILNADKESECLRTFDDLRGYKRERPDLFILAPHPFHYGNFSLRDNLEKHIDLFDAIELSWFYSRLLDRNAPARRIAEKYEKPFLATSDTHYLSELDRNFTLVDSADRTAAGIFEAIRRGAYRNVTTPRATLALLGGFGWFTAMDEMRIRFSRKSRGDSQVP